MIALFMVSSTGNAQQKSLSFIDKADLKSHMTFFASDEMKGRNTGTPENDLAALYLKTQLMRLGLNPITETGDYYQNIPVVASYLDPSKTGISIKNIQGEETASNDSIVFLIPPPSSIDVTGEVVFAGYGINDANSGYNDFEGINLKDKIVLIMTGRPNVESEEENSTLFSQEIEGPKLGGIFAQSPKALLFVYNPRHLLKNVYESGLADALPGGKPGSQGISMKGQNQMTLPFPILFITQHTANTLLKPTGHTLGQFEEKIVSGGEPVSSEIEGITASISASIEIEDRFCPNVIGIIEGSDPVLKNECIVYSAHFDHVGPSMSGEIMNGADDNASGSIGLLEIAEAFMRLKKKPSRTVVFAWVNAEEKGLYGSRYYADHPVISMEKTVLNINFDMIGRSRLPSDTAKVMGFDLDITESGQIMAYTAPESAELIGMMNSAAGKTGVEVLHKGPNIPVGSSDHASFLAKGVPAICFNSGIHSDLHGPGDDVEKIDFDKMEKVSKMGFLLGYEAANKKEGIKLDE